MLQNDGEMREYLINLFCDGAGIVVSLNKEASQTRD